MPCHVFYTYVCPAFSVAFLSLILMTFHIPLDEDVRAYRRVTSYLALLFLTLGYLFSTYYHRKVKVVGVSWAFGSYIIRQFYATLQVDFTAYPI